MQNSIKRIFRNMIKSSGYTFIQLFHENEFKNLLWKCTSISQNLGRFNHFFITGINHNDFIWILSFPSYYVWSLNLTPIFLIYLQVHYFKIVIEFYLNNICYWQYHYCITKQVRTKHEPLGHPNTFNQKLILCHKLYL